MVEPAGTRSQAKVGDRPSEDEHLRMNVESARIGSARNEQGKLDAQRWSGPVAAIALVAAVADQGRVSCESGRVRKAHDEGPRGAAGGRRGARYDRLRQAWVLGWHIAAQFERTRTRGV